MSDNLLWQRRGQNNIAQNTNVEQPVGQEGGYPIRFYSNELIGDRFLLSWTAALTFCAGESRNKVTREIILDFAFLTLGKQKVSEFFKDTNIANLSRTLFAEDNSQIIMDFLNTLSFQFFSRIGSNPEMIEPLISSIADSVAADHLGSDRQYLMTPHTVNDRLPTRAQIIGVLKTNHWVLMCILIILFVKLDSFQTYPNNHGK